MFKCDKCGAITGPCEPPIMQAVGFYRNEHGGATGNRLGEAKLCKKCALAFKGTEDQIVEVMGGYRFAFFRL